MAPEVLGGNILNAFTNGSDKEVHGTMDLVRIALYSVFPPVASAMGYFLVVRKILRARTTIGKSNFYNF